MNPLEFLLLKERAHAKELNNTDNSIAHPFCFYISVMVKNGILLLKSYVSISTKKQQQTKKVREEIIEKNFCNRLQSEQATKPLQPKKHV